MPQIHDRGYRRLFSNRTFFRQLLESFVAEDWVKDIDFSSAEVLDRSFITEHYKQTETDLLYKVKFRGREAYIYLLIEFQSSVVWFMALRLLHYISGFWLDYLHQDDDSTSDDPKKRASAKVSKLPPVFPLLVYSGSGKWTAATELRELLEFPELLGDYVPQFRYLPIAANSYGVDHLQAIHNLVSTLFLAETHDDFALLKKTILELYDHEDDRKAMSLLVNWFRQLVIHGRRDVADYEALHNEIENKREAETMIETMVEQMHARWKQEGIQEGIDLGRQEGIELTREEFRQNQLELVLLLLEDKFEKLSEEQLDLLQKQSFEALQKIILRLKSLDSLQDVLRES